MAIGDALLARFKHAVTQQSSPAASAVGAAQLSLVLDALSLLAPHAEAAPLLESLLAWRSSASPSGGRGGLLETAFWEAVCRLAGPHPPPAHVAEAVEALAVDALLQGDTPGGAEAAERAARALGLLSPRRFDAIAARFIAELEARLKSDASAQARRALCHHTAGTHSSTGGAAVSRHAAPAAPAGHRG